MSKLFYKTSAWLVGTFIMIAVVYPFLVSQASTLMVILAALVGFLHGTWLFRFVRDNYISPLKEKQD